MHASCLKDFLNFDYSNCFIMPLVWHFGRNTKLVHYIRMCTCQFITLLVVLTYLIQVLPPDFSTVVIFSFYN